MVLLTAAAPRLKNPPDLDHLRLYRRLHVLLLHHNTHTARLIQLHQTIIFYMETTKSNLSHTRARAHTRAHREAGWVEDILQTKAAPPNPTDPADIPPLFTPQPAAPRPSVGQHHQQLLQRFLSCPAVTLA